MPTEETLDEGDAKLVLLRNLPDVLHRRAVIQNYHHKLSEISTNC
jgi:hypothetical protein